MNKKDKKNSSARRPYTFKRVSENLYKVIETGGYYALVKRGGKQIRRSLKTTDEALPKLGIIEVVENGIRRAKGQPGIATTYRWNVASL